MDSLQSLSADAIVSALQEEDILTCLDAIHSAVHLQLLHEPSVMEALASTAAERNDCVSGLASVALIPRARSERGLDGVRLRALFERYAYTATVCYLSYAVWMGATRQIPLTFTPSARETPKIDSKNEHNGTKEFKRIIEECGTNYLLHYLMALSRIGVFNDNLRDQNQLQSGKLAMLLHLQGMGTRLWEMSGLTLAWSVLFLSHMDPEMRKSSLGSQVIMEEKGLDQLLRVEQWRISASGHGCNVIDTLYELPKDLNGRRKDAFSKN